MRTWMMRAVVGVIVLLVAVQFMPIGATNPPVEQDIPTSAEVKAVLQRACYDCHSHETVWPWYSHVAPFSWLIARDVREGREKLNFSTWNHYSTQEQVKKLEKTWQEIDEGKMPLWFYLPVHREARLADADRATLRQWALQQ
jgi:heme-binding protein